MTHTERMREIGKHDLSFPPKSIWNYTRGSFLDTLINDEKCFDNDTETNSSNWMKKGRGSFLSKFNSEYSKRIIEMWSKKGDNIIDPFSGRSSRALTSTLMKRNYTGFDVINDNLQEAKDQYDKLKEIYEMGKINLINDTSENILNYCEEKKYDLLLTCPPYFNIEKYDSVPNQLTDIKTYDEFLKIYKKILEKSVKTLKPGKFICIVLANFRINGIFYDFRGDTADILKKIGMIFHDEIILEMSPAKREPLYNQAIVKMNCLKTHEYLIVFKTPSTIEEFQKNIDEINFSRPLVMDTQNREKLFWKNKKDWINEELKNIGNEHNTNNSVYDW